MNYVFRHVVFLTLVGFGAFAQPADQAPPLVNGTDFVHVCADAGAGAYEAFPDVCRLADGRLMCVFYAGWTHVSLPDEKHPKGGRVSACYSSDEGATWTPAVTVYDGPDDDRDPSVVQMSDGRILVNFFSLRGKEGGAYDGLGSWLVESSDAGKTWSEPISISKDYYCSAPIRVIPGGELMVGLYIENGSDAWGAVSISSDAGKTWGPAVNIPNGGLRLDAETDVIALKDGSIYAAQRTQKEPMRFSISTDKGRTWKVSEPMGFPGHCPYLYRAPNDAVVCAHRLPETSLHYSMDECKTWSSNVQVDTVGGAYPSIVTLKDMTSLIVYYEEGEGSSIRARKFTIGDGGVRWITWK
jgi:sialidase-1